MWEPIEPHDPGKIVERPFRKGSNTSFVLSLEYISMTM